MTQTNDPQPPRRRKRGDRRGKGFHALRALLLLLVVPVVFAAIALVMMFDRDITAPSWVTDLVAERASTMLGGGAIEFGDITLRVGPDLHPRVRLHQTQVSDAAGTPLAQIDTVDATISPRGLLFDRAALVQRVALSGTAIDLTRDAQGQMRLTFMLPESGNGALLADGLVGLVRQIDTLRDRPVLAALESLTLDGLDITYRDERADRTWTATSGSFAFGIDAQNTTATAQLQVAGDNGVSGLGLRLDSPRGSDAAAIAITITDAQARDLASQSAAMRFLGALDAPLSASLRTALNAEGELGPLNATLTIGAGALQPGPQTAPLHFDGVTAELVYDPSAQRLQFTSVDIASDWGSLQARGQALARDFDRGLPDALVGQFTLTDIALNPAGLYPVPITLDQADIDLRLRLDPFRLDMGQISLSDPALTLTASGALTATDAGWNAAVDVQSPKLGTGDVLRLWPEGIRPGTRLWFTNNILGGDLTDVVAGWRKRPGEKAALAAGFAFEGASVRFLKQEPPIVAGAGYATLAEDAFVLRLDKGQVIAPQGGALDVAGSVLQIPNIRTKAAPLVLDIATSGSITGTLAILDQPPFQYLTKANLPVTLADGRAAVQAHVTLPLKPKIAPNEIDFDATANLSRVRSTTLVKGRTLASSDLAVSVDRGGMQISGAATLDGVPLNGRFAQEFGANRAPTQITGRVNITPQALDTFGIALPARTVSGAGTGQLAVTLAKGVAPRFTLTSDLVGLGLSVPAIGYSKSRGSSGTLEVAGTLGANPAVERLSLRAPGLQAAGAVSLTAGNQLEAARLSRVVVGDWFDGAVTLRGRGRGRGIGVEVLGGALNLSRASFGGSGGDGGAGGGSGQGLPIAVRLDSLTIADGLQLTSFNGNFDTTGGFRGDFTGLFNGQAGIAGSVSPSRGRSAVRIRSDDAGAVLRAGNFVDGAYGGSLDLTLLPAAEPGTFDGTLGLRLLRVRDAPAIAALLDAISVVGLLQQLDGQGLAFDEVDAQFRLTPNRIVVTQSSAVGPGLGISLDGIYTLGSRAVDFQGVVSPFYLLNGIGSFLTRKGEGLIGFNFTVRGTPGAPQVGVNPLSVFTPGMFREIFRRPVPEVSP
ncbi:DUF3971 domain-containing protein [Loktanella salsilacus]|uniref:YhdP family protein n=1 Tax=Loktanella salsilacus TaxID=195913 RepID=UPI003734CDD0